MCTCWNKKIYRSRERKKNIALEKGYMYEASIQFTKGQSDRYFIMYTIRQFINSTRYDETKSLCKIECLIISDDIHGIFIVQMVQNAVENMFNLENGQITLILLLKISKFDTKIFFIRLSWQLKHFRLAVIHIKMRNKKLGYD